MFEQNKEIVLMCAPPGAGKDTFIQNNLSLYTRISQDDQGKEHLKIFENSLKNGENVVISRMNFNKVQRDRYLNPAKKLGYKTKIVVLHESRETCLQRCKDRLNHPTVKTEEDRNNAINFFFSKYERPTLDEADKVEYRYPQGDKPSCVLVDLDGTLCNIDHRLHFVKNGKKDWKSFFENMNKDTVNDWCRDVMIGMATWDKIVLCSGRPDNWRQITSNWLEENQIEHNELFMRPRNDSREDSLVKEILLDFEILTRYKPSFAIDDRPSVCRMWRSRGIVTLQCQGEEF